MILTMVEIINESNQNLELPLMDLTDGYLLANVDGLDPVKATLSSSTQATLPGEQFQSSRRTVRDVALTIELLPDYITNDVAGLRRRLYTFLSPASPVTLKLYFDNDYYVYATGRVESFDTALFTQDPAVVVLVRCFDPDFIAAEPTIFEGTSVDEWTYADMQYQGDQSTGFVFRTIVAEEVNIITVGLRDSRGNIPEFVFLNGVEPLAPGELLEVSTVPGDKFARRIHEGVIKNALGSITLESNWFKLAPGFNEIAVLASSSSPISYTVEYNARFGGV
mgnify:CR=1 FL=1